MRRSRTVTHLFSLALALAACARGDGRAADSAIVAGAMDSSAMNVGAMAAPLGDTALATASPAPITALPAAAGSALPQPAGATTTPSASSGAIATPAIPLGDTATVAATPAAAAQAPAPAISPEPPQQAPVASASPTPAASATPASTDPARARVPFGVGERYVYDVKFGAIDVGDGVMEVLGEEAVRGRQAYRVLFRVSGGTAFFKVRDRYESWMDVHTLQSLRHIQDIDEASYERRSVFEFFPERGAFQENQRPERPTVAQPLDDGSFFFFVRTIPLEVGQSYTFERYFKPDRNPVRINVLRRERVRVPAGTFDAIVIQPVIKTKGVFGEGGRAEIWIADDSTRAMLQMKSRLKFGSLNLFLKSARPATR